MNKLFRLFAFSLLAVCLITGGAYAADGDIYRDPYTSEDSSGNWTLTGNQTIQGTLAVTGNVTNSGTVTGRVPVTEITTSASTPSLVTTAKSGYTFVFKTYLVGTSPMTIDLPASPSVTGLRYTFTTATGTAMAVRSGTYSDTMYFGQGNKNTQSGTEWGTTRVTSPASSGSTVTFVSGVNCWYVQAMAAGGNDPSTAVWSAGTR